MIPLLAATLLAHGLPDPRVLVVVPSPEAVEIRVNELEQPGRPSIEMRRRFDGDGDGKLSAEERELLLDFLGARAIHHLEVRQDGTPLPLETTAKTIRGATGPVDASDALSVDVVVRAKVAGAGGPKRRTAVEISDHRADGHPVRAAVAAEGVTIVAASRGTRAKGGAVVTGIDLERGKPVRLEWAPGKK